MSAKQWQRVFTCLLIIGMALGYFQPVTATLPTIQPELQIKGPTVEPELQKAFEPAGTAGYLIYFKEKADLAAADRMDWTQRGQFVVKALQQTAERTQATVRALLDAQGVNYTSFWIDNMISVEASDKGVFNQLLTLPEIESLRAHRTLGIIEPVKSEASENQPMAVEPNIAHVGAPDAWALGINGAGIVVANIDTGVRYTHQALVSHYRGNLGGGSFEHNYNWFDPYGEYSTAPADGNGHGSHTMGTIIGDDGGANQIGMAPGAEWMACRGCNTTSCTDVALLACAQFIAAPTNLGGTDSNPDLRPNVVNNSWGDCSQTYDNWYQGVVDAWQAAGIYPVFSNGNASNCFYPEPPGLNTVGNPARYGNITGVGSSGESDGLYAPHSNWGPTDNPDTINPRGYPNLKPQVIAPGVNIRSSVPTSDTSYEDGWSGTSMSAPHVSGLVALVWQAAPCLVGDYAATETLIEQTANPVPYDSGGTPPPGPGNVPNYATGWGEIDALAAVQAAQAVCGDSTLSGTVSDGTNPIEGAQVTADNGVDTRTALTAPDGSYSMQLWAGTYTVSVEAYGFLPDAASGVVLQTGQTTVQDFSLTVAPLALVAGKVSDQNTGWPLYAKITIDGYPGGPLWNDPVSGDYSINLPQGMAFTFHVNAQAPGYNPALVPVGPLGGNLVRDFALEADPVSCSAPGYGLSSGAPVFGESFDAIASFPGGGWDVVDVSGTAGDWITSATTVHPSGQLPHSGAQLAYFNSFDAGSGDSTRLFRTSGLDLSAVANPRVEVWVYHDTGYANVADRLQVQASLDGGATWSDVGAPINRYDGTTGWATHTVDLSAFAGLADVRLGLLGISAYGNNLHIDDLSVAPMTCEPQAGSLVVGNVYDENTGTPLPDSQVSNALAQVVVAGATEDPNVADAFFSIFAPEGDTILHAELTGSLYGAVTDNLTVGDGTTLQHDLFLPTGQLVTVPVGLAATLDMGAATTLPLSVNNTGGLPLSYQIFEKDKGFNIARPQAAGGPDAFGYAFADSNEPDGPAYDWIEISATGTPIIGLTDDNFVGPLDIGFGFNYYGTDYSQFYAGSNGLLTFGAGTNSLSNQCPLPSAAAPNNLIAMLWDDLNFSVSGSAYYQNFSTCPYGVGPCTVIEYANVAHYSGASGSAGTWETILFGNGNILIQFQDAGVEAGSSSTTGIENADGLDGLTYPNNAACNLGGSIQSLTAVCFAYPGLPASCTIPDVPWLAEDPITGTIPANNSQVIDVSFDAGVPEIDQPGDYFAELQFYNDTPYGIFRVPITLTVNAPPTYAKLEGTVTGLGYCDANPAPLTGVNVLVEGSGGITKTLITDELGYYTFWMEASQAPLTVSVAPAGHQPGTASGVELTAGQTTSMNFDLRQLVPCVSANPTALDVQVLEGHSLTLPLNLANNGAAPSAFGLRDVPVNMGVTILDRDPVPQAVPGLPRTRLPNQNKQPKAAAAAPTADVIQDGSFEAGTPNPYWDEYSLNFGTPLCTVVGCGSGGGTTGPHSGDWWAWFGGASFYEQGSMTQTVTLPAGAAQLSFWLWIGTAGNDADYMTAYVDGNPVFTALGSEAASYAAYTQISVDISAYADGGTHVISFGSETLTNNVTNFSLDDVAVDSVPAQVPWLSEDPAAGTLAADGSQAVDLTFTAMPTMTLGAHHALLYLTSDDPFAITTIPVTMTIAAIQYGASLSPDASQAGQAGTVITYTVAVTNTGNVPDTFDLAVNGNAWSTTFLSSLGPLGPGEAQSFNVEVAIPASALGGDSDTATLTATSQGDAGQSASIQLTTNVPEMYGVDLSAVAPTQTGMPGEKATYQVTVHNSGNTADTYLLGKGGDSWVTTLSNTNVNLLPGASTQITVEVTIPANAMLDDSDAVTLSITSQGDGTKTDSLVLTTSAGQVFDGAFNPEADAKSGKRGTQVSYSLQLTNMGNGPDTFTFTPSGHQWAVSMPDPVALPAGGSTTVTIVVSIPMTATVNESDTVTVTMTSNGAHPHTHTAALTTTVEGAILALPLIVFNAR